MDEEEFGFVVSQPSPGRWRVYLPDQSEAEWDIAGWRFREVSQGEAIAKLSTFIAEAQSALDALRRGEQFGKHPGGYGERAG